MGREISQENRLERRRLGRSGLTVSSIGLGCMAMAGAYGQASDVESVATIHRALDLGMDLLDTSDVYGGGRNEELVGRTVRGRREDVTISTKFGNILGPDGRYREVNGRPEYVEEACEESLRRLATDWIDLYYLHRVDPNVPIEETVGAMADLVADGKVRFLGLSEARPTTLRRAHAVHPISALQTEYSLWSREPEILPTCRELGVGFVAYSPLGRGFLAGRIKSVEDLGVADNRVRIPRFQGENLTRNLQILEELEAMATTMDCTSAQLALAWLLAQGADVVPIPGTKRSRYVEENRKAVEISLEPRDIRHLEEIAPLGVASGERYNEAAMKKLNR